VKKKILQIILVMLVITGCQTPVETVEPGSIVLTPYATRTSIVPPTFVPPPTLEPQPTSVIPTQITHVVSRGEDMGGIANLYRVKTADLKAANPEVNPLLMPVGTVLIIPSGNPEQDANRPTAVPTPAVILPTGAPVCHMDVAGGAWCLVDVTNKTGSAVEDISADFVLTGTEPSESQTRTAFGLIDRLPDGRTFPLAVYFPVPPPQPWQVNIRLLTAFPVLDETQRYLKHNLESAEAVIADDRTSARVKGLVFLHGNQSDANIIWVAAAVYNSAGQPVGVRRWESQVGLESGSGLTYDFSVYSLVGAVTRVEVLSETRK
jgi:LysM repeat protein